MLSIRSCSNCQSPIAYIETSTSYSVSITDSSSKCSISEIFNIWTESKLFVPNAFSPNGDGINDIFKPIHNENIEEPALRIFNRWGILIYHSSNLSNGWNGEYKGKRAPVGVYVWTISYKYHGAEDVEHAIKNGSLTLIR